MLLFASLNLLMFAMSGVQVGGDTNLYLDGATRLLDGRPLINREPSYTGYVALIAGLRAVGAGFSVLVLLQIGLAAIATGVVYSMGAALAGRSAGAIAAMLLAVDIDTNRWHLFVLADSVYLSLFTIGVYLTYVAATREGAWRIAGAVLVLLGASLVRPEGWFLMPAAALYLLMTRLRSVAQRVIAAGAVVVMMLLAAALLAPAISGNLKAVGPAEMLRDGQTIWEFDGWRVEMPPDPVFADGVATQVDAITYAARHPVVTASLMAARVGVHFAHVRPYFSSAHNAAIVLWLVPIYVAVVLGLRAARSRVLALWIVAALTTQLTVVALTHADWDGRYLAHMLPVMYPFAGVAMVPLLRRIAPRLILREAHV